jgi:peptidoglycan hydrolase CwlO-like protein
MEAVATFLEANKFVVGVLFTMACAAGLWWLSKYFVPRRDFKEYQAAQEKEIASLKTAHSDIAKTHQKHQEELSGINGTIQELKTHIEHLPTGKEITRLSTEVANLNGKLEGLQPLLKTLLNNDSILIEAGLRTGERNGS